MDLRQPRQYVHRGHRRLGAFYPRCSADHSIAGYVPLPHHVIGRKRRARRSSMLCLSRCSNSRIRAMPARTNRRVSAHLPVNTESKIPSEIKKNTRSAFVTEETAKEYLGRRKKYRAVIVGAAPPRSASTIRSRGYAASARRSDCLRSRRC
jgi:hypothetical protein